MVHKRPNCLAVIPAIFLAILLSTPAVTRAQETAEGAPPAEEPPAEAPRIEGVYAVFTPYAGFGIWGNNTNLVNKPIYGARAGVQFHPYVALEGSYAWSPAETEFGPTFYIPPGDPPPGTAIGGNLHIFGLDLVFTPPAPSIIAPYLAIGGARMSLESDDPDIGRQFRNGVEAAVGFKLRLAPRIAARIEARDLVTKWNSPPATDDVLNHNLLFSAGVQLALGGRLGSVDADNDGVGDAADQCPDTPLGVLVDARGCPIDGDNDGVPDGIDQCANTPAGAQVDARGCPADSDNDGVPDGIDQCANTPAGSSVDARGCPADSDNDGVPDGVDQCANTPAGASVDARGCPTDSDADGIVDGADLCPNTPAGAQVDKDGCPIEVSDREVELLDTGKITVRDIHFETAKWTILPESHPILDEIGRILIQWPQLRIEIGGHADARGSNEYNLDLSQKRAQAVLDYLVAHFPQIDKSQYTAKGYGESQPVASNSTVEGMARNRRVEFKVLNTEVLTKERERRRLLKKDE
jgi:OmpA-OmpF porin, OOP family